ncbi:MAG: hypothetical protein U0841_25445 [Chloroflexia bacterium]
MQTQVPGDEPVDVVAALYRSRCEFAAQALGGRIRSLVLISPTGLGQKRDGEGGGT